MICQLCDTSVPPTDLAAHRETCHRGTQHTFAHETRRRQIRAVCLCGNWVGQWRDTAAFLLSKQLRSDESTHIYATRRASA